MADYWVKVDYDVSLGPILTEYTWLTLLGQPVYTFDGVEYPVGMRPVPFPSYEWDRFDVEAENALTVTKGTWSNGTHGIFTRSGTENYQYTTKIIEYRSAASFTPKELSGEVLSVSAFDDLFQQPYTLEWTDWAWLKVYRCAGPRLR